MSDDRHSYKGSDIGLEMYGSDSPSGVVISSVDKVVIFQDKEVCYTTTSINRLDPDTWEIRLNTDQIKYSGDYEDWWYINGDPTLCVKKSLTVTEISTIVPAKSTGNYSYYSKDLTWSVQSDGDLYRIFNEYSIAAKIEAVVMTIKGSLFNEPDHGTNIYNYLFSLSPGVADEIRLEAETEIQMQIPHIKVDKVTVVQTDFNVYSVSVNFYSTSSTNPNELLNMTNLVSIEPIKLSYTGG
jgi:phage baseplate assembly protein W